MQAVIAFVIERVLLKVAMATRNGRTFNMFRIASLSLIAIASATLDLTTAAQAQQADMSFFVSSVNPGKGGDLGGLAGADAHCQALAMAAGSTSTNWAAYLS